MHNKIRKLVIAGFRGIRHETTLDLTNREDSLLLFGANAKGKSSIGDAFEWFFTNEIKELTKEGCTRDDYRHRLLEDDENTVVSYEFSDAELNSEFTLNKARNQNHSNQSDKFKEYIRLSNSELLILRHKDLKQFVDETKGEKRKEISQLIGMEEWEKIRTDMQAVANRLSTTLANQQSLVKSRQNEVNALIEVEVFSKENCWEFGKKQAKVLGIKQEITNLESLRAVDEKAKETTKKTDRSAKLAKINSSIAILDELQKKQPKMTAFQKFAEEYNNLSAEPEKVLWVQLNELYKEGKSLLESGQWVDDKCPLCLAKITSDELLAHIEEHQEKNKATQEEIATFDQTKQKAIIELDNNSAIFRKINNLKLDKLDEIKDLKKICTEATLILVTARGLVEQPLKASNSIVYEDLNLGKTLNRVIEQGKLAISQAEKAKESLAPTDEETARIDAFQNISTLASHMAALDVMEEGLSPLEQQVSSMEVFTSAFQDLRRKTMGEVLDTISNDVSRYFLALHAGEGFDDIRLQFLPNDDGIEFHIYYKGEEITPPRRFLSESYLNGLGVCLFLATVRAFNKANGFVVLDDIVNSFDAEHRADLAKLLVDEFEDFQLIVLTHDSLWFDMFRRLARRRWQHKKITRWSYEGGIEIEQSQSDAIAECHEALALGEPENAARIVRTYIEFRLKTIMKKVGGRMRWKAGSANDARTGGELLFELKRTLNERGFFVTASDKAFNELETSSFITNYGSHDQIPAPSGLSIGDVKFAFERMNELENAFICPDCNKKLWKIVGEDFSMQCQCGNYSLK